VVKGLGTTLKHFFKGTKQMVTGTSPDAATDPYAEGISTSPTPRRSAPTPERWRGVHRLTHRDDGSPRCVACLCCSTACPAQCIYIKPGEYPEGDARRGYERYPVEFVIDELRCIFCGFCVEACPCDAIRMDTGTHMTASTTARLHLRQGQAHEHGVAGRHPEPPRTPATSPATPPTRASTASAAGTPPSAFVLAPSRDVPEYVLVGRCGRARRE
jgi:formate hydrogenlyase subunit 6/NADH:ubiquinone oxidoreductase subunit I